VSESELTEKCVSLLLEDDKARAKKPAQEDAEKQDDAVRASLAKLLAFMGLDRGVRVIVSPLIGVAFSHGKHLFAPRAPLTRSHLIRLLNSVQVLVVPTLLLLK